MNLSIEELRTIIFAMEENCAYDGTLTEKEQFVVDKMNAELKRLGANNE